MSHRLPSAIDAVQAGRVQSLHRLNTGRGAMCAERGRYQCRVSASTRASAASGSVSSAALQRAGFKHYAESGCAMQNRTPGFLKTRRVYVYVSTYITLLVLAPHKCGSDLHFY